MRSISSRCVIAGGGPAGVMLGYLLARAGIDTIVLEKWPDFFRDFRGDTIHPSTMEVLHELGLLDDFLKLPHNEMTRMTVRVGDREATVADLSLLHVRCPYIAFIPQWDFLNFLSSKATAFPSFHLMMETEATELIEEGGKVVGVRAKNKGEEFEIRAELIVGADGRHSTIREKGGFEVENLGVPIDVLWFRIGRGGVDDKQSLAYLATGHALVMLDRRDYWQCAFLIEKGGFDAIKAQGLDAFRKSVASIARMPLDALDEVDTWDKVKLLSVTVDHVRQWAQNGVLLIGDSAHAMSPLGGVGINYAVHDAVAAGNILVPAFHRNDLSLPVLQKVQARREKPVKRMQKLQVFLQDRLLLTLLRQKNELKMPWFLNFFGSIPFLRSIPARIIGIGFGPEHIKITF
ncbi:MAG TPA: FAD-dependent oxidoreductase [Candidatus Paceibacterota bacterium]|nr:FAD-dependent oxidoreductase [Candidatus Paceibacterota bacterium]